jgi:cell division protein FtsB
MMNWPKLTSGIFLAIFAGISLWAGVFFLQMHQELTAQRSQEAANRRRLDEAQARLEEQRKYLDRLQHDPALVETLIRKKLGYARSDEFVFRFEVNREENRTSR